MIRLRKVSMVCDTMHRVLSHSSYANILTPRGFLVEFALKKPLNYFAKTSWEKYGLFTPSVASYATRKQQEYNDFDWEDRYHKNQLSTVRVGELELYINHHNILF